MIALAIVISSLVLIALLRFGAIVEYSEAGLELWAKAGFLRIKLIDPEKEKKPKKKKKKKPKKKSDSKALKPGSLKDFTDILKAVANALKRLKRRLLIKQLTIHFTSANENPANTATMFGAANAVFNTIIPLAERNFRIKKRDLRASTDFCGSEQKIYAKVIISIAVWEVFYMIFALLPILVILLKSRPKKKEETHHKYKRKDGKENGKAPD